MGKQLDIQNSLRILAKVIPDGIALEFGNGDLITVIDHRENDKTLTMRTQDLAEEIIEGRIK